MKKIRQSFLLILSLLLFSGLITNAQVKNIAHRGGAALAPENTLAAFRNAIAVNADYYELDVQMSKDDSLVIMHDGTINRTTTGAGTVSVLTYAQLRAYDAGVKFNASFTGEPIPTLYESLVLAKNSANKTKVVIEIKTPDPKVVPLVVKMVQDLGMQDQVLISSFNFNQIKEANAIDPTIPIQVFVSSNSNAVVDQLSALGNSNWIGSSATPSAAFLEYAHSKNVKFNMWTINAAPMMKTLIELGADGITTDNPLTFILASDTTPPADVNILSADVVETKITLKWDAVTDAESDIIGYEIYRDTTSAPETLFATTGKVTEYTDQTNTELKKYYYRMKARNGINTLSANFSNEISATTSNDKTKPLVSFVTSNSLNTQVIVDFNELVDSTTAVTLANYTINKAVTISDAQLALDKKSVILTTSELMESSYSIIVKGVKDKAIKPNTMATATLIFMHKGLTANTVAYYSLDSAVDSTLVDGSANLNNGTLKNDIAFSEGILGNGMVFDGVDDHVEFKPSTSFDIGGNEVTISVWAKLNYLPADLPTAYGPLFDSETDNYVIYADRGNNELRFKVTTSAGAARPGIPAKDLVLNEWVHIVGVYDGANAFIYMNGVLKGFLPVTGTVKPYQQAYLGRSSNTGASYFKGSMDEVLILNKALKPNEVVALFKSTKSTPVDPAPGIVELKSASPSGNSINLTWNEAINYESKVMGYQIYRDTKANPEVLYATVNDTTEFTDMGTAESSTYYYRIKAKNVLGLSSSDYSNEISAKTGLDKIKPELLYITSVSDPTKVVVEFSEALDKTSAELKTNYSLDNNASVLEAKLSANEKSVILMTTPLEEMRYTLVTTNIKDKAAAANMMLPDSAKFDHKPMPEKLVAYYQLDNVDSDSVVVDLSGNMNNGFVKNGPMISEGILGNGMKFDGVDDYVQFSPSASFDIDGGFVSVSVWTKLDYLPTEMKHAFGPLFDSQGDEFVIYADRGNKELRFKATSTAGAARPGIPQADLITGQWINVIGVFDGVNASVYLNGVFKASLPLGGTVKTGIVPILGVNGTLAPLSFFSGSMDNIQIFNYALSQEEITNINNNIRIPAIKKPTSVDDLNNGVIPNVYSLEQNYPNPFNPTTTIKYQIPKEGIVQLKVFDILGREVSTLINEIQTPGNHKVNFDGKYLSSGVYFYRLTSGSFVSTKKFILIK
ncbi:MAG: T9SS type A sorting domain-containing protein [Melioribacteraceae bacterium]|nr:T9SS type A sorting domain-containing protein [Melioribacteraceae bacterium]